MTDRVCVVIDIESDGPEPGRNALCTLAVVALDGDAEVLRQTLQVTGATASACRA